MFNTDKEQIYSIFRNMKYIGIWDIEYKQSEGNSRRDKISFKVIAANVWLHFTLSLFYINIIHQQHSDCQLQSFNMTAAMSNKQGIKSLKLFQIPVRKYKTCE